MNGFIIIDKEKNISSFKADIIVRSILHIKKTGHGGTLDPMATGVLPIAIGNSTRFIDLLPDKTKSYTATFRLGDTSDTLDITGNVTHLTDNIPPYEKVSEAVSHFTGKIQQLPPMYSAISKNGVRLYELARKGIEIEREKRQIEIFSSSVVSHTDKEYVIDVECSKGTYIRTLIDDIGTYLGCGAVMTELRRTKSNGFTINDAITFDILRQKSESGLLNDVIIPTEKAFISYPALTVSQPQAKRFSNGGELNVDRLKTLTVPGNYRVYSPENEFLGLGVYEENDTALRIKRVFVK